MFLTFLTFTENFNLETEEQHWQCSKRYLKILKNCQSETISLLFTTIWKASQILQHPFSEIKIFTEIFYNTQTV